MVAAAVEEDAIVGLDVETTGLDSRTDRIRLLSLNCDTNTTEGGRFTYLIDCFAVDPRSLWEVLADRPIVAHNAAFDLSFLAPGSRHDAVVSAASWHAETEGVPRARADGRTGDGPDAGQNGAAVELVRGVDRGAAGLRRGRCGNAPPAVQRARR